LSDGQKYTLNSKFSSQPWSLLVNVNTTFPIFCLMWLSAISLTPREFGIGNMKHQRSHQCSQIIPESKSQRTHGWLDLKGKSFNEWSADSNHIHSEGEWGYENPWEWSATVDMREEMKGFWVRMSLGHQLADYWPLFSFIYGYPSQTRCCYGSTWTACSTFLRSCTAHMSCRDDSHVIGQGISSVVRSVMGAISCR